MQLTFASFEHAIATTAQWLVTKTKMAADILSKVDSAAIKLQGTEQFVEGVTAIVGQFVPQAAAAVPAERLAYQLLGMAVHTYGDADKAAAAIKAGNLSLPLTAAVIADVTAIAPAIHAAGASFGIQTQAALPAPAA